MGIKIIIYYPHLRELTDNLDIVEVEGCTIGQCLGVLVDKFPAIRNKIFDENDNLRQFVNILHNNLSTHMDANPLLNPVQDGDEIGIILLIAGG